MKIFEYKVTSTRKGGTTFMQLEIDLNELGLEGWELCGIEYGAFIFKREKLGE